MGLTGYATPSGLGWPYPQNQNHLTSKGFSACFRKVCLISDITTPSEFEEERFFRNG